MDSVFDCITFFDENFLVNSRIEILKDTVDYFIICESKYDHRGNKKNINFKLNNKSFSRKVRHIVVEENFPNPEDRWGNEAYQREKLFLGIKDAKPDDLILFSDSDEIPNPEVLKNFNLKNKFGIFMQRCFVYKLNIFNEYESPWEGTRVCRKRNLKSFTHLRKKILKKNLSKSFWKFNYEKNIDLIPDGGWHFNNLYSIETISKKLKVSPHKEFSENKYSDPKIISQKISNLVDLYNRGHNYKKIEIDQTFPNFFIKNPHLIKDHIL